MDCGVAFDGGRSEPDLRCGKGRICVKKAEESVIGAKNVSPNDCN